MHALDLPSYQALREGAKVLEADGTGDKVLRLVDGTMLKLFRRKRWLSSAAWSPYAQRFANHCSGLRERGIECPQALQVYRIASIERDAVHYEPLPGATLRQLLDTPQAGAGLRAQTGQFIARLHEAGVYFRSAHLGNLVLTPEGTLGLIDIADLRLHRRGLGKALRLRNFKHMLRYPQDRAWLLQDTAFAEHYLASQKTCNAGELAQALR